MPNPNYAELRLVANYGEDENATVSDGWGTRIYPAISDDSDEIDHKFVYQVPLGGLYIELAHYASVKQVVVQNMSTQAPPNLFPGTMFYIDNTTGALVNDWIVGGEHMSFCDPDVTAGIMLYSIAAQELTDWHIAICGRLA
jgi:hypothetical protein